MYHIIVQDFRDEMVAQRKARGKGPPERGNFTLLNYPPNLAPSLLAPALKTRCWLPQLFHEASGCRLSEVLIWQYPVGQF